MERRVHNYMVYAQTEVTIGSYDPVRLAIFGIGHGGFDGGAGYTYFDPKTGYEFSAVAGLTYNLKNRHTDYQNGVDAHIDWAASKFLWKDLHVGLVGYYYQQLTGDSGSGARLGDFKGRTFGIGPQIGHMFKAWEGYSGYVNLKGYREFGVENRAEGWSGWVTLVFSPATPEPSTATTRPRIVK